MGDLQRCRRCERVVNGFVNRRCPYCGESLFSPLVTSGDEKGEVESAEE